MAVMKFLIEETFKSMVLQYIEIRLSAKRLFLWALTYTARDLFLKTEMKSTLKFVLMKQTVKMKMV